MLIAHLVPGYFMGLQSKPYWRPEWSAGQRTFLWLSALGSTVVPDMDVVYNALFRSFFNHSTLWTHSLFPPLSLLVIYWGVRWLKRWPYLQIHLWLIAVGILSHLLLDVIAHGTPLLYPLSIMIFGHPPQRVVTGGLWAYLTDPIFLIEPFLLLLAATHWLSYNVSNQGMRTMALITLIVIFGLFTISFLLLLPMLQEMVIGLT